MRSAEKITPQINRRRFISIVGCTALFALAPLSFYKSKNTQNIVKNAALKKYVWRGTAMGADMSFTIISDDKIRAQQVIGDVLSEIKRFESYFSIYDHNSVLSQLNQKGVLKNAPAEFKDLITESIALSQKTNGYFDITIQSLYPDNHFTAQNGSFDAVGYQNIAIDGNEIRFLNPKTQITLNGIAQGYVTDRIKEIMMQAGIENSLIELGEKYALGDNLGKGWAIEIADSKDNQIVKKVNLKNKAIATSSNYGDYFGNFQNHIINPIAQNIADGKTQIKSATIIAPTATQADAYSTAVVAAGKKSVLGFLNVNDIELLI
ncbi:MAG: FAD:protein FMN transferase [Proteobacteria bacterium]|nr:FAD:protein FMN transferase [Pseudomonadota bacterium]